MRRILIKTTFALALGIAPGIAFAQAEMPKKKMPEQSEGQSGGGAGNHQNGGQGAAAPNAEQPGGQMPEKPRMKSEGNTNKMQPEGQGSDQGAGQGEMKKHSQEQNGQQQKHGDKSARVNDEQRGELRRMLRGTHVQPAPNIDFSVDVGARIPRSVHLYRLPPRIVDIVPGYQGYMYFLLADGRIAIVDPNSLEIIFIVA
jgi:hypothetical protein